MREEKALRWRCRRGLKELDELLLRYLQHVYPNAAAAEQARFAALLDWPDERLTACLLGRRAASEAAERALLETIRELKP